MERKPTFQSITRKRQFGFSNERATRQAIIGSKELMQRLKLETKLDLHRGCVNTISWNDSGYRILSGADDKQLCISDPYNRKKLASIVSGHRANIFSAKFMPCCNDSQIVSCSGDGQIAFNDVEKTSQHGQHIFNCHYGTAYEVVTVPNDPYTFLSCGEDGTVRWFDLRSKNRCMKESCREDVLINCRRAVTSLAINPIMPYHLGVGCSDSSVRVYDRRMLGTRSTGNYSGRGIQGMFCRFCPPHLQNKYSRPTSLQYAATGDELLVSYSSDYIYLFGTDGAQKDPVRERREGFLERGSQAAAASSLPDDEENPVVNPIKRLRLRGDWSDTGPKARPRGEQAETQPRLTFIQRMSEMLTRWLDDSTANLTRQVAPDNPSSAEANSRNEQSASNVAGPSSTQQSTFPFSGLQRTSTEERPASPAVQQRLRDIMTSKIKAEEQGGSTAEASSSSHREDDEMAPPQDEAVEKSSKSQKAEMLVESETNSDISSGGPGNVSRQTEKESTNSDLVPTGAETTCAITDSVQSTGVADETSDGHESSAKGNDKICTDCAQEGDITNAKNDSKKRKRSPNSSTSSSSLTDDPALDKNDQDISGKPCGKRNSKTQRKVTREGSEHDSSPSNSDSDSDKSPAETSRGDNLRPSRSNIEANKELIDELKTVKCTGGSEIENNELQKDSGCSKQQGKTCEKEKEVEVKMDVDPVDLSGDLQSLQTPNFTAQELGTSSHCDVTAGSSVTTTEPSTAAKDSSNQEVKQIQSKKDSSKIGKQSPIFALGDRMEDTNPQERRTGQFTVISQRQRRLSVSGPAGTPPPPDADVASTSSRVTPREVAETPAGAVAAEAAPASEFIPETPSITCSETDSDDDLILRPPRRRRRYRRHESDEDARRPRPPSVTESRLRELFRARREAREKAEVQLSDVMMPEVKMVYKGHRNSRTMIKQANFWGDNFVLSGSDCGHVFIWNRHTAELVMLLEGDRHVVNCVQPHPFDHLLATSGIDYDVKLWSPLAQAPCVPDDAAEVMRINELMLDETRDTITVPPSFMLRMLTTLNHLRAERHRSHESSSSSDTSENEN